MFLKVYQPQNHKQPPLPMTPRQSPKPRDALPGASRFALPRVRCLEVVVGPVLGASSIGLQGEAQRSLGARAPRDQNPRLEEGDPQQFDVGLFFAWCVENKGTHKEGKKTKTGPTSADQNQSGSGLLLSPLKFTSGCPSMF